MNCQDHPVASVSTLMLMFPDPSLSISSLTHTFNGLGS